MTNDRDTLKNMLNRAKIEYTEYEDGTFLTVERGYVDFSTTFEFDANGNLKNMGAYNGVVL